GSARTRADEAREGATSTSVTPAARSTPPAIADTVETVANVRASSFRSAEPSLQTPSVKTGYVGQPALASSTADFPSSAVTPAAAKATAPVAATTHPTVRTGEAPAAAGAGSALVS